MGASRQLGIRRSPELKATRVICAVAALLVVVIPTGPSKASGEAPTGFISATREDPYTHYLATISDPEDDPLTYKWSPDISCGSWGQDASLPNRISWWHGEPGTGHLPNSSGQECTHPEEPTFHRGVIRLEVSDGTNVIVCEYRGMATGQGSPCEPKPPKADIEANLRAPSAMNGGTSEVVKIVVGNNGPDTAEKVKLTFNVASGGRRDLVRDMSAKATRGNCKVSDDSRTVCNLGPIPRADSVTVSVRVRTVNAEGKLLLRANASAATNDPKDGNNQVDDVIRVR